MSLYARQCKLKLNSNLPQKIRNKFLNVPVISVIVHMIIIFVNVIIYELIISSQMKWKTETVVHQETVTCYYAVFKFSCLEMPKPFLLIEILGNPELYYN
jgi:hypothetical protein